MSNEYWTQTDDGVIVLYRGGDDCWKGTSTISYVFHCNPSAGAGVPKNVVEIGEYCHYVVHVRYILNSI